MRKLFGMILCASLAAAMAFTAFAQDADKDENAEIAELREVTVVSSNGDEEWIQEEAQVAGWQINADAGSVLTQEESDLFSKVMEGFTGVNYEPVAVIATQLVSGTNYAYLCKGTPVAPNPQTKWYVVSVYENLDGAAQIIGIHDFNIEHIRVQTGADDAEMVGAWSVKAPENQSALPSEVEAAFSDNAIAENDGVRYQPVVLLASQVVAGMNYRVLCYGENPGQENAASLYVLDIYTDLDGNARLNSSEKVNLAAYVGDAEDGMEFTLVLTDQVNGSEDEIVCLGTGSVGQFMRTYDGCEWEEGEEGIVVTAINGVYNSDSASWNLYLGGMPSKANADNIMLEEGGVFNWVYAQN